MTMHTHEITIPVPSGCAKLSIQATSSASFEQRVRIVIDDLNFDHDQANNRVNNSPWFVHDDIALGNQTELLLLCAVHYRTGPDQDWKWSQSVTHSGSGNAYTIRSDDDTNIDNDDNDTVVTITFS